MLDGKQPITVTIALRMGKLCGDGGSIWMPMQQSYDRKLAEVALTDELAKIPTLEAAV